VKKKFQLQITLAIDNEHRQEIIDKARKHYSESGGAWELEDDGKERMIPAEEFIESIDDVLMELIFAHPAFDGEHIELIETTCDCEENARDLVELVDESAPPAVPSQTGESTDNSSKAETLGPDDLNEYETDLYLCRWPNGDFSVVAASSKMEAIIALDEWGGAEPSQLYPIDSFMADFTLTNEGEIVLREFGEDTRQVVWDVCYPELDEILNRDDIRDMSGRFRPGGRKRLLRAVKHERTRLWENQPTTEPTAEVGKMIARQLRTSGVVADYYAEQAAMRILKPEDGEDGKPN
jgi:hypothetical protein